MRDKFVRLKKGMLRVGHARAMESASFRTWAGEGEGRFG